MSKSTEDIEKTIGLLNSALTKLTFTFVLLAIGIVLLAVDPDILYTKKLIEKPMQNLADIDRVEGGIHLASGLIAQEGYEVVNIQCGRCHSLKLVTQNSATRDGWKEIIRWMQETQNLGDLGALEPEILDYLSKHYGPRKQGRRASLTNIEWYELEE